MKENIIKEPFKLHYYFENKDLHSINAHTRNKAEKHILDLIESVNKFYNTSSLIESNASKEGGFQDWLDIINNNAGVIGIVLFAINHFLTRKSKEEKELVKLQLEKARKEVLEDNNKDIKSTKKYYNKIIINVSHFYEEINRNANITSLGITYGKNRPEDIVPREDFEKYIIEINDKEFLHENAIIEIISPVLNEKNRNASWSGEHNEKFIKFKMMDKQFREDVDNGNYSFVSGVSILCRLREIIKYDENGEIDGKPRYKVEHVYSLSNSIENFKDIKQTTSEIKKPKQKDLNL